MDDRSPVMLEITQREYLLTMAQVARRLGVSHEAIRDRVRRGTIKTVPMLGKGRTTIGIPESALDSPAHKGGRPRKNPLDSGNSERSFST